MKNIKIYLRLIIATVAITGLYSCSEKEVVAPLIPSYEETFDNMLDSDPDMNNICVWNYVDFANNDDVKIVSADTSFISVSKAFLEKNNQEVLSGNILAIILSEFDDAFVRKAVSIDDQGDRIVVGTEMASIEEMFKNLDIELSSEPYYNEQAASSRSNSKCAGYVDANKVLHPTRIVIHSEDGEKKVIYPAQMANSSRATLELSFKWDLEDSFNFANDDKSLKIDLNDFKAYINTKVKVSINISWFKLQSFYANFYGDANFDIPIALNAQIDTPINHKMDTDLKKFKNISATYWIGPVPISVGVQPAINYVHDVSVRGKAQVGWGFDYKLNFDTSAKYERESGWQESNKFSQDFNFKEFTSQTDADLYADMALYAKFYLTLYNWRTVYAKLGAYTSGAGHIIANENTEVADSLSLTMQGYWGLRGGIGTDLRIGKIKLFRWDKTFDITGPHKFYETK